MSDETVGGPEVAVGDTGQPALLESAAAGPKRPRTLSFVVYVVAFGAISGLVSAADALVREAQGAGYPGLGIFAVLQIASGVGLLVVNFFLAQGANWARITMCAFLLLLYIPVELLGLLNSPNAFHRDGAVLRLGFYTLCLVLLNLPSTRRYRKS